MFSTHAVRHIGLLPSLRRPLAGVRTNFRNAALVSRALVRPQALSFSQASRRSESTKEMVGASARSKLNRLTASLDLHTVYQSGRVRTITAGFTRIVTIVVFGCGLLVVAPRMYLDPDSSNWLIPATAIGGAIPLLVVHYLTAPMVATIRMALPPNALRSRDTVLRFARSVPHDTEVRIQCWGLLPWPYHKRVYFGDLRRIPDSRYRRCNLQHIPLGLDQQVEKAEQTWKGRLLKDVLGGYYVDRAQITDKSQTPGAWDLMWEQIPELGSEEGSQKPVGTPKLPKKLARPEPGTSWYKATKPKPRRHRTRE